MPSLGKEETMLASEPDTVIRLKSLKTGEEFPFYSGNLEANISKCNPHTHDPRGAPAYQQILIRIRDTAEELRKAGRIRVRKVPINDPKAGREDTPVFRYIAVGR